MKRILPVIMLCLVLLGCSEQEYIDISALQSALPTLMPSMSAAPAATETSSPSLVGALSDAEVEAIIGRTGQVTLNDSDVPYLEQIVQDLQPILEAFESLTNVMTTADLEDEEWVKQASEYAAALENACDTAIKQDYGENLNDLEQLLNAGYDAFQKGASSLQQAVNNNDTGMISTATGWLMLGIEYETKATEYLQALTSAAATGQPGESPQPSVTKQPSQSPRPSGT